MEWIYVSVILFASAFLIGVGGFGFTILAVSLLPLLFPVKMVVPFSVNYSLALFIFILRSNYKYIEGKELGRLFLAMALGIPLGVFLLRSFDEWLIRKLLAIFILGYSLLTLTRLLQIKRSLNRNWAYLVGLLAGSLNGAFGTGGPPVIVYVTARKMEKLSARGLIAASGLFMQSLTISLYSLTGLLNWEILKMNLLFSPAVALGALFGHRLFLKVNQVIFHKIILFLMILQGCILLVW